MDCNERNNYPRCKCRKCMDRMAKINRDVRRRRAARAFGVEFDCDKVDGEAAHKLVADAVDNRGVTQREVAQVTGLSRSTVKDLYHNRNDWILRSTHNKVTEYLDSLELQRAMVPLRRVPAKKYAWVVHALAAQGWTTSDLRRILRENGRKYESIARVKRTSTDSVTWENAQNIKWLAKRIGDRRGPSQQNAARMLKRGFFPLIHYTEDGRLIESSLTPEQRRVQSKHGKLTRGGDGPRP